MVQRWTWIAQLKLVSKLSTSICKGTSFKTSLFTRPRASQILFTKPKKNIAQSMLLCPISDPLTISYFAQWKLLWKRSLSSLSVSLFVRNTFALVTFSRYHHCSTLPLDFDWCRTSRETKQWPNIFSKMLAMDDLSIIK